LLNTNPVILRNVDGHINSYFHNSAYSKHRKFWVTWWATRISKKSLDHSIEIQKRSDSKDFVAVKTEVLQRLSDDRSILEKTRIEIGALKADFEAEPQPVQTLMSRHTNLFTEYLPAIERSIRQLDELWDQTSKWGKEKDYSDLVHHKAFLYKCMKDDEIAGETGLYLVKEFKEKLRLAKEYASKATR
jgi:hypothetical protein